jgi:hypothetical protein
MGESQGTFASLHPIPALRPSLYDKGPGHYMTDGFPLMLHEINFMTEPTLTVGPVIK